MKIALVTPDVHPNAGVPNYVASLAVALAVEHQVSIFSVAAHGLGDSGIVHHRVWALGGNGFLRSLTFSMVSALLLFLSRFRNSGRYDIIHTHGDYIGLENVLTSHYCQAVELDRHRRNTDKVPIGQRLQRFGMNLLERRMVNRPRSKPIIVPSEHMKRDLIKHHGANADHALVIHSGVDSKRYNPQSVSLHKSNVRRRHSIADQTRIVLFVGGDWDRKGLANTIVAMSTIADTTSVLMVVGPGSIDPYRAIASDLGIEHRIIFAGSSNEVWKYYGASDVLVLPAFNEAFGLVVLEAMASGMPVLVSSLAGASELVRDGVNGLLIDPASTSDIASKLDTVLLNETLRKSMGISARETALNYTWDLVAQRHVTVYKAALGQVTTVPSNSEQPVHVGSQGES